MNIVPDEELRLASLFRRAYELIRERIYGEVAERGFPDIRPAHSSVFRNITPGGSRVVELAERAGMTKQSMAYLTDALAGLGYVRFEPDPSDGRAKLVKLTERGQGAVETLTSSSRKAEEELTLGLGAGQAAALRAIMGDIVTALEQR